MAAASPISGNMHVYFLRRFLPVLAALVLIGVVAWPAYKEFQLEQRSKNSQTRLRVEEVAVSLPRDGKPMQLTVTNPEFTGQDNQGRPYVITATRIIQDGMTPGTDLMNLQSPTATLYLDQFSKEEVRLTAATGLYNPKDKTLQLNGPVRIAHSDGYVLDLQDLLIDLIAGSALSQHPASGSGPSGTLQGEKLELRDKGNTIILHGKSKVVLTPKE